MPDKLAAVQAVIFTLLLCAASVTDLTKRIVPNWLCLGIAGVSIIGFTPVKLLGILIALPFLLAAVFFGGMGGGDIKFVAALGCWFAWPQILLLLLVAFILGGLIGVALLLSGKKGRKDAVPFGPFLALAALLTLWFSAAWMPLILEGVI